MTPSEIRFAANGMLWSLATWLRLLGYDCLAEEGLHGRALLERAVAEDRVFLTRNVHLAEYLPHVLLSRAHIVKVANEALPGQLREVVQRFALDTEEFLFTRCLECNEPLRPLEKPAAVDRVPPRVGQKHDSYWTCPHCGKVYWRGSHVTNSIERMKKWLERPL